MAHRGGPEIKDRECERVREPNRESGGRVVEGEGEGGGEVMKQREGNETAISSWGRAERGGGRNSGG